LVTDGDMRESDAEWLKEQYPVPEEKASAK
jgi:hypothetical protein